MYVLTLTSGNRTVSKTVTSLDRLTVKRVLAENKMVRYHYGFALDVESGARIVVNY